MPTNMKFWNFFKEGSSESMTRLITFAIIVVVVVLSLYSMHLAAQEKFDAAFGGFILALLAAALTGKVQGAKIEKK